MMFCVDHGFLYIWVFGRNRIIFRLRCRFVYSGRTKKEESWEDGADFLPFEQLLKVAFPQPIPLISSY